MNTKITFHLPAFFMFVGNLNSRFNAQVDWNNVIQTATFQSQKVRCFDQLISYLRATSINIDSSPLRVESLTKAIQPSIYITTIRCEFCHLESPTF